MKTSELDTLIKVDSIISTMAANMPHTDEHEPFLTKPTFYKPKSRTVMKDNIETNNFGKEESATARFYEMNNGTIHESYSIIDTEGMANIPIDNAGNQEKDLIIILSDDMPKNELIEISNKFRDRLKLTIHYGTNNTIKSFFEHFSQIISVSSLKKAVNKSYLLAQNGQTIFFPHVNNRFDFFGNIDFA